MTWIHYILNMFSRKLAGEDTANRIDRLKLLAKVAEKLRADGVDALMADLRSKGIKYQTEYAFIYCIDSNGRVTAHSISNGLVGADLRQQLNGEPLKVLEKMLLNTTTRTKGDVHYHLNPHIRVEMSYLVFGEIIVIAQSKLIPASSG